MIFVARFQASVEVESSTDKLSLRKNKTEGSSGYHKSKFDPQGHW